MRRVRVPFILVALMLTMSWAAAIPTTSNASLESPLWTAEEAAENWYESEGAPSSSVAISSGSGRLWVQTGEFDPVSEQSSIPTHLQANDDPFATGFFIMQLYLNDGVLAESLAKGVGATIVDTLPEDAWVLRLPSSTQSRSSAIIELAEDDPIEAQPTGHQMRRRPTTDFLGDRNRVPAVQTATEWLRCVANAVALSRTRKLVETNAR